MNNNEVNKTNAMLNLELEEKLNNRVADAMIRCVTDPRVKHAISQALINDYSFVTDMSRRVGSKLTSVN